MSTQLEVGSHPEPWQIGIRHMLLFGLQTGCLRSVNGASGLIALSVPD